MTLLILYFLFSIIFSFLCSIWEATLLSIPPSRVQLMAEQGTWLGKKLRHFKEHIDKPLSAILTLNTIAHTVGAIGVGIQASILWGSGDFELFGMFINIEAFIAALMTLGILILSEIIPKTIGASYWDHLIGFTVYGVHVIGIILTPFVWLSQWITKLLKKDKTASVLSRAEFSAMAEVGARQGELAREETRVIRNLLRFSAIRAKDIMTPRPVVIVANADMTIREFYDRFEELRFSRIPVYEGTKDNITGFILKDAMLEAIIEEKEDAPVRTLVKEIKMVHDTQSLPEIFEVLIEKRSHIAAVIDEYGAFVGIVTVEDIIETLLGMEILDELDNIADMQQLARENWQKRATKLGLVDRGDDNVQ